MPKNPKLIARWRRRARRWAAIAVAFAALTIGGMVEAKEKPGELHRRWVEARERLACEAVTKAEGAQFVCEEAANAVKGYPPYPRMTILDEPNEFIRMLRSSEGRNEQKDKADSDQFLRDYRAATERGISIEAVVKERLVANELFNRWLEARERWACELAAKTDGAQFVCEEAAWAVEGYPRYPSPTSLDPPDEPDALGRMPLSSEGRREKKQRVDLVQFERDRGEAAGRGISIEDVVKERLPINDPLYQWLETRARLWCETEDIEDTYNCGIYTEEVRGYLEGCSLFDDFQHDTDAECRSRHMRKEDRAEFEKDNAEAGKRNIALEAVLKDRKEVIQAEWRESVAKYRDVEEAEQRYAATRDLLIAGVSVATAIALLYKTRRRITGGWRRRSKAFRAWVFASLFWLIGVLLFVIFVDPYFVDPDYGMNDEDFAHMLGVMLVPPLFFGAIWFGYKRFVD